MIRLKANACLEYLGLEDCQVCIFLTGNFEVGRRMPGGPYTKRLYIVRDVLRGDVHCLPVRFISMTLKFGLPMV